MFGRDTSVELLWSLGLWPGPEKLVMVRVWRSKSSQAHSSEIGE